MASSFAPHILTFKAGGTIVKGHAVKLSAKDTVVECTATTDKAIGIAQADAASAEFIEVALPGGGAKAKAQGTINAGALLVSHTDGTLKKVAAASDRVIAMAMESAVAGDVFSVHVVVAQGTATES